MLTKLRLRLKNGPNTTLHTTPYPKLCIELLILKFSNQNQNLKSQLKTDEDKFNIIQLF